MCFNAINEGSHKLELFASDERFDSLKIDDCVLKAQFLSDISEIKGKKPNKDEPKTLESINAYREFLPNLKILDPACGSGAFLNKALEFLINEHRIIKNALHNFKDITLLNFTETTILEHNLYGVDINANAA
ncbi:DNA methyltransferase [Campylobacter mucosalis]|uniref:DNA methyltransferase n=1 Tax=Campylobacter mucosalis TaxID=202 RepID=UPI00325BB169